MGRLPRAQYRTKPLARGYLLLRLVYILAGVVCISPIPAEACDPCALYNASRLNGHSENSFVIGLSEQFTSYELGSSSARNVRDAELTRGYSTTQLVAGFDPSDRFGVQISVPFVYRSFDRIESFRESDDEESGLGDISLVGSFSPLVIREPERAYLLSFFGGVKFPTGDSGSIGDSVERNPTPSTRTPTPEMLAHHQISQTTGLGGRILTLGTGSTDYILGTSFLVRRSRALFLSTLQYTIRTEGDFDYRFSNDLVWNVGPGLYLVTQDDLTLALRAVLSGEEKGQDRFSGEDVPDSKVSNVYLGPELIATIGGSWTAECAAEVPVSTKDYDLSVVPDYRLRIGVSYRFS